MGIRNEAKEKMGHAMDHFHEELKNIRTGRANPGLVENVPVEVYGTQMRLKELASINTPELRQILITPFDGKNTQAIGKAIELANLGINPIVDGNQIRLNIPAMDEALRKEMVKLVHKKLEECKVAIRNIRRELNDRVRKEKKDGELPEDQMKKAEHEIQEETDAFCKKADGVSVEKEKEIMTV